MGLLLLSTNKGIKNDQILKNIGIERKTLFYSENHFLCLASSLSLPRWSDDLWPSRAWTCSRFLRGVFPGHRCSLLACGPVGSFFFWLYKMPWGVFWMWFSGTHTHKKRLIDWVILFQSLPISAAVLQLKLKSVQKWLRQQTWQEHENPVYHVIKHLLKAERLIAASLTVGYRIQFS